MKKIILVTGATGAQGGSVARVLLENKKFTVRVLTRNVQSRQAQALEAAGAELAEGDFDNVESLQRALEGVYGVFGVTNFWEHFEKEFQQGKNLIDAVKLAGVEHFVYSSLKDYKALSGGALSVPHCDIKAALKHYAKELQLPATFTEVAFYYENFLTFFPLQKDELGSFFFGFPGAEELANMFEVQRLYIPNRQLDLIESYGLNPNMQRFESWLRKHKGTFIKRISEQLVTV